MTSPSVCPRVAGTHRCHEVPYATVVASCSPFIPYLSHPEAGAAAPPSDGARPLRARSPSEKDKKYFLEDNIDSLNAVGTYFVVGQASYIRVRRAGAVRESKFIGNVSDTKLVPVNVFTGCLTKRCE